MPVRSPLGRSALLLACAGLAGCTTLGPDYARPTPADIPAHFGSDAGVSGTVSEPSAAAPDPRWWAVFGDATLTRLAQRVAAANLDVQQAGLRLAESRAALGVARSDLAPSADGNTVYTRQQISKKGALSLASGGGGTATAQTSGAGSGGLPNTPQSGTSGAANNGLGATNNAAQNTGLFSPFDLYQYGFDASWELDLWGRVRRNVEAADANATAAADTQRGVLIMALAELARDYVQLRGVQRKMAITQDNLETAKQSLKLTQDRAQGGLTTDLDVANAAAQVANTASELPNLQAQADRLANAMALLLGQPPQALQAELAQASPIPPVPPRVPVGLPSELARRRPDIRQAEAALHAATAAIGVAQADFYPRITLSASAAIQATQFADMGSWAQADTWAFGPSLSLPIFEGGRLRRVLDLRQAQQQEAAIVYHRTVLTALHDVDNALSAYRAEQLRRAQLQDAATQFRRALKIAQDRYAQGVADFLTVLDAERSLLAAEQALTDSTATVSTDLVQIYKALGGGWEGSLPEQPNPADAPLSLQNILP